MGAREASGDFVLDNDHSKVIFILKFLFLFQESCVFHYGFVLLWMLSLWSFFTVTEVGMLYLQCRTL